MKLSQIFVVVVSVIGLVTFLNPDGINDPKFTENMVLICRIGMAIFLLEIVPMFLRKIKNETLIDILSFCIFPVTTAVAITLVDPDIDYHLIEMVMMVMVFVSLIFSGFVKRKLVKRWGVEINSYHSDETP